MDDPVDDYAFLGHAFACTVCGLPGECSGECDGDLTAHVHFAEACWEVGPPPVPTG